MKRYIAHHFPNELKTYALLTLSSVLTDPVNTDCVNPYIKC
ncbi:hypothetical protein BAZOLSSOX_1726 [uncultured Gammaproteobacteria bacterium]|nr:hypothetical protein BAZOLSSOX_1726 [uncultured Gammaproteobacteria bacterium]